MLTVILLKLTTRKCSCCSFSIGFTLQCGHSTRNERRHREWQTRHGWWKMGRVFLSQASYRVLEAASAPLPGPGHRPGLKWFRYVCTMYCCLPQMQLNRLQHIQNALARAVVAAPTSSNPDRILKSLHWLKVQEGIKYKVISARINSSSLLHVTCAI